MDGDPSCVPLGPCQTNAQARLEVGVMGFQPPLSSSYGLGTFVLYVQCQNNFQEQVLCFIILMILGLSGTPVLSFWHSYLFPPSISCSFLPEFPTLPPSIFFYFFSGFSAFFVSILCSLLPEFPSLYYKDHQLFSPSFPRSSFQAFPTLYC